LNLFCHALRLAFGLSLSHLNPKDKKTIETALKDAKRVDPVDFIDSLMYRVHGLCIFTQQILEVLVTTALAYGQLISIGHFVSQSITVEAIFSRFYVLMKSSLSIFEEIYTLLLPVYKSNQRSTPNDLLAAWAECLGPIHIKSSETNSTKLKEGNKKLRAKLLNLFILGVSTSYLNFSVHQAKKSSY